MPNQNPMDFVPEGWGDMRLLTFFRIPPKWINRAEGIHQVAKAMESQQNNFHKVIVGLVDDDKKNIPTYFNSFEEQKNEHHTIFKKKVNQHQYLIVLQLALEQWLFTCAESVGIKPSDCNMPDDLKAFTRVTKNKLIETNEEFTWFLKALREAEAPAIMNLKEWLQNLPAWGDYNPLEFA